MAVKLKLLALLVPLVAILLVSVPLYNDSQIIKKLMLHDQPVHIMPFDETVETIKRYSYQSCADASSPLGNVYFTFWERDDTVAVLYTTREMRRLAMIYEKAYKNNRIEMLEWMLADHERTQLWLKAKRIRNACLDRIFNKHDRSPEIGTILTEAVREIERIGCEKWSWDFYETAADYFFAIGQDEKAFGYLQKSYELSLSIDTNVPASHSAGRIGEYYRRIGDFEKAQEAFSQSLIHARLIEDHYSIARALSFMARLKASMGDFIGAEMLYLESIDECECIIDPVCELQKVYLLAELYNSFGHIEKAVYLIERSILLAEKNIKEFEASNKTQVMKSLTNYLSYSLSLLAEIQLKQGENEEAVLTMEQTLKRSRYFIDRLLYAELEKIMSEAYIAVGRFDEASRNIDNSLKLARALKKRRLEAECLATYAELRIAQGKLEEADDLIRKADDIAAEEGLWMPTLDTKRLRAESAALRGHYREALDHYEKAVALFDATSATIIYEEDKHAFSEKMKGLYESIIGIQDEYFNNSDSVTFWAEKCRHRPHGDVCKTPAELAQVIQRVLSERDWIPDDAIIIQCIVTESRLIVIAMESDRAIHHSTPINREHLERQIQEFFETCYRLKEDPIKNGTRMEKMAENFYAMLIEPFSDIIEKKKILCFVPEYPLHRLPFAALMKPNGGRRFLVEGKQITEAPSLLEIFWSGGDSPAGPLHFTSPLLIGHPEISPEIRRIFPGLDELPHTAREIAAVEKLIGNCTTALGPGATASAFLQNAEESDLIHIATHTITYPPYGGKSALVLSPEPGDRAEDRIMGSLVFETDIRNLHLDETRLVVISSCESAPGNSTGLGSGPGLAGGFLHAGADAVIATIWPIEDRFTEAIIAAFYRELLSCGDPSEALCNIQRALIAEDRSGGTPLARVCEWGPFIAIGPPVGLDGH